jgi:adenylate cyclase
MSDEEKGRELAQPSEETRRSTIAKLSKALRRADQQPRLLLAAKLVRELLPGDSGYGDSLSTAGAQPSQQVGRRLSALTAERPSLLGEIGLSALQVWDSISDEGTEEGPRELAILFTDLVDFSDWSLRAGDTVAVDLLREVDTAIEPAVTDNGGEVVKRLGDGLMAVFREPAAAVTAALRAGASVGEIDFDGYRPEMRAGVHVGHPKRVGGDYLGIDVNIAARLTEAASGGEVLISEPLCERLEGDAFELKKRRFKAKGAPRELAVYRVKRKDRG